MGRKMEFWDEVREPQVFDIEVGVIVRNPPEVVDRPFTSDVIRDDDVVDQDPFQHGCDNIICVYIPA